MKQYYTYLWLREDGIPYYVGKGSGKRAYQAHRKGNRLKPPKDLALIIIQYFESEEDAFFAEKFLIAFWGRKDNGTGILRNLTDGGENPPNRLGKPSAMKGQKVSEETRKKQSISAKRRTDNRGRGVSKTPWNKGLVGINNNWKDRVHTEESRAKMSTAAKSRDPKNRRGPKGKPWSAARRAAQRKNI